MEQYQNPFGRRFPVLLFLLILFIFISATFSRDLVNPLRERESAFIHADGSFHRKKPEIKKEKASSVEAMADLDCKKDMGGSSEVVDEECINRRSLEAHLDYIYTQEHKHP
eukprot:TRINITY_DN1170_c0_g1_i2.p1 TRINITY_DN1170_c0_g1~~TRINITY_DN1170_c0_g1_i2.p1  ORF type:complete len:111 (-),score=17.52 TRINITY_DN1170_c0_g1_i2:851-1183(-)